MIAASLNSSALYAGIAFGSLLGAATLDRGGVPALGWVGALSAAIALVLLAATARRRAGAAAAQAA
jgi:predicted MFS family arabinose efflux permease